MRLGRWLPRFSEPRLLMEPGRRFPIKPDAVAMLGEHPVIYYPDQAWPLIRHQIIKIGSAQHGPHGPDQFQQLVIPDAIIDAVGITSG